MKKVIFILILIFSSSVSASPETEELIELLEYKKSWVEFIEVVKDSFRKPFGENMVFRSQEEEVIFKKHYSNYEHLISQYFSWDIMSPLLKDAISERFSLAEQRELIAFLRSNTGKKFMSSGDEVATIQQSQLMLQAKQFQAEAQSILSEYSKEMESLINAPILSQP